MPSEMKLAAAARIITLMIPSETPDDMATPVFDDRVVMSGCAPLSGMTLSPADVRSPGTKQT
jgi:hypothetical protein